jgi:uncharacterized protein
LGGGANQLSPEPFARAVPDQLSPAASISILSQPSQKAQITQQNIAYWGVKTDLPKTVINTTFVYAGTSP